MNLNFQIHSDSFRFIREVEPNENEPSFPPNPLPPNPFHGSGNGNPRFSLTCVCVFLTRVRHMFILFFKFLYIFHFFISNAMQSVDYHSVEVETNLHFHSFPLISTEYDY